MTTVKTADASPHKAKDWHDIDWRAAQRFVRRLQTRIVKAVKQGKWREVKNLQRLLRHSFYAKCLAVKRVTENRGKRTAGVDGETWRTSKQKWRAIERLGQRRYRPKPLKRIYIPKPNGKKRPISIPTMLDRAQQALYLQGLEPVAETRADPHSYGFRRKRSTADAIAYCYLILGRKYSAQWVLEGDIKSCFDKISHRWLEANIPMDRKMLKSWLKCGFVDGKKRFPTEEGTPQGGIASPVLSNMALDGLERELKARFPSSRKPDENPQVHFVRYADDFLITGRSKELLEKEVKPVVEAFLAERGLTLSAEKTHITHIEAGVDFLGYHMRKIQGRLRIKPSQDRRARFWQDITQTIKANIGRRTSGLIKILNSKLRGWGNYYRIVSSWKTFSKTDNYVFWRLWRWARQRHPLKNAGWVKRNYFPAMGRRKWQFTAIDERGRRQNLFMMKSLSYRRHILIKGEANPFDPDWGTYFEQREARKVWTMGAANYVKSLLIRQQGRCSYCEEPLESEQAWRIHYSQSAEDGAADKTERNILLHRECHAQYRRRKPKFHNRVPQGSL